MAKGNVGSLLVFDPAKIKFSSEEQVKSAAGDAVVGIVTERGLTASASIQISVMHYIHFLCLIIIDRFLFNGTMVFWKPYSVSRHPHGPLAVCPFPL